MTISAACAWALDATVQRRPGNSRCRQAHASHLFHGCQMVGFKHLTELCEGLFGLTISQGAISNMLARMGKPFGAAAEQIAATVHASEVIANDDG